MCNTCKLFVRVVGKGSEVTVKLTNLDQVNRKAHFGFLLLKWDS